MSASRGNAALTDICRQLIEDWRFSPDEIAIIALNISGECEAMHKQAQVILAKQKETD